MNLNTLRQVNPLVVCQTNSVVTHMTANHLIALGASPVMSEAPNEQHEMLQYAHALLINIGTLNDQKLEYMHHAMKVANELEVPIILDPVGAGATSYRTKTVLNMIDTYKIAVLKGNFGEIASLVGASEAMKGVDSQFDGSEDDLIAIAKKAHDMFSCNIVITGERDIIYTSDKYETYTSGTVLFTKMTGAGCVLGSIIGAMYSPIDSFESIKYALLTYHTAGMNAEEIVTLDRPGAFQVELLNQLHHVSDEEVRVLFDDRA